MHSLMILRYMFFVVLVFLTLVFRLEMKDGHSGAISLSTDKEVSEAAQYAALMPQRSEGAEEVAKKDFRLLFLGNSLTYTNDLPGLVKEKALQRGWKIRADVIALPNYAIIDHWVDGKAKDKIATGKYDFVIVQQGPSSQPLGRQLLIEGGRKFAELCREKGARLCYFMVWPSVEHFSTFDALISNHEEAASINGALLFPVGKVWKAYIDTTGQYDYYGKDGFHPSEKGSSVAAEVIVDCLFGSKDAD